MTATVLDSPPATPPADKQPSLDDSRYGLIGQFRIKDALQKAAVQSGLAVVQERAFSRYYRVTPVFNYVAMDGIVPAHIRSQKMEDGSHRMTRGEVKKLLAYMNQPLRGGIAHAAEQDIQRHGREVFNELIENFGDIENVHPMFMEAPIAEVRDYAKTRRAEAKEELLMLQRFLSFGTTGSVLQGKEKKFHHQAAKVTDDDEHVGIQEQIEEETAYRTAVEMDGKFVEGAQFDRAQGVFALKIHPAVQKGEFEGPAQQEMAAIFRKVLNETVPDQAKRPVIRLTANELSVLCDSFHREHENVKALAEKVSHEEHIQHALEHIHERATAIEKDKLFDRLNAARGSSNTEQRLHNILKCTTALTGLLQSDMLEQAWKRYHFMDRDKSPIADILKEAQTFQAVASNYIERGNISAAELEAITHEFMPLMMFGADAMRTFSNSLDKVKGEEENALLCAEIEEHFRGASMVQSALTRKFMPEDKRNLLEALDMYAGEKKFSASKKVGEVLGNYVKDIGNSIREHPKITIGVIATLVALLRIAAAANPQQAAPDPERLYEQIDLWVGDTTISTMKHASELKQEPVSSCHLDLVFTDVKNMILTGSPMKTHCFGEAAANLAKLGELWRAPLRYMMELTGQPVADAVASTSDHPFIFGDSFNETLPKVDRFWQWTNYPQDLSHSGYWGWSGLKGIFQGLAGTAALFKLFNPMIDLGYTSSRTIGDKLTGRKKDKVAAQSMSEIVRGMEKPDRIEAAARPTTAQDGPAVVISSAWAGTGAAAYDGNSLEQTKLSIDRMQMRADHLADENGLADSCRRETVKKEMDKMTQIIEAYQASGDVSKFQKDVEKQLARAAALEYAHSGRSEIYDSMMRKEGQAGIDEKTGRKLRSLGLHIMRNSNFNQIRKENTPFISRHVPLGQLVKSTAFATGSLIGNAWSHTLKAARLVKETKPVDLMTSHMIKPEWIKAHVNDDMNFLERTGLKAMTTAAKLTRPIVLFPGIVSGTAIYYDNTGKIQELSPTAQKIVQTISDYSGDVAAAAFSTANFFGWNVTVSDLLQVHFVTGVALSTLTALSIHYPNRFAVRPLSGFFRETVNQIKGKGPSPNNTPPQPEQSL
jgi:hypothetical protein